MTTLIAVWMIVLGAGCMLVRLAGILGVVLYARHVGSHARDRTDAGAPARNDHDT